MAYEVVIPNWATKEVAEDIMKLIEEKVPRKLMIYVREEISVKEELQKIVDKM